MERTISFMNGEGFIGHNTRRFIADNVDASRTKNNITLIHEDIKQAYHKLFDKALKEYNAKQKRKDKLDKAYEFMKQFVIGEINLLEKFMEWIGEKVKDVGRGREK